MVMAHLGMIASEGQPFDPPYKMFKFYMDKYLKAHPEDANEPHITAW